MIEFRGLRINGNPARQRGLGQGNKLQRYVDNEVISRMDKYTPFKIGTLKSSPIGLTTLGSGTIHQRTPYARRWYYTPANFSEAPMRGNKWFERMKNAEKGEILQGMASLSGGRTG